MNASLSAFALLRRSAAVSAASHRALGLVGTSSPSRCFGSSSRRAQTSEVTEPSSGGSEASPSGTPDNDSLAAQDSTPAQATASGSQRSPSTFLPPPIPRTFEELRYFQPPESAPLTHGVHVATLTLWTYGPTLHNLENFSVLALRVMGALGIPHSGIARLPTQKSLWTVPKSPFVHKKAQENFERRTHRRAIKMWDANPEVVDRCLAFLREHTLAEVQMKAQLFRYVDVPTGLSIDADSTDGNSADAASGPSIPDAEGQAASASSPSTGQP
ncbi:hypothetical protein V8E36_003383 [Tilletia maclaganii]